MENQLTIPINFISSEDVEEECVMHSTSDNIKFKPDSDGKEVAHELFSSLSLKYQLNLETSMRRSDLIFDFRLCIKNVTEYILYLVVHILILETG